MITPDCHLDNLTLLFGAKPVRSILDISIKSHFLVNDKLEEIDAAFKQATLDSRLAVEVSKMLKSKQRVSVSKIVKQQVEDDLIVHTSCPCPITFVF